MFSLSRGRGNGLFIAGLLISLGACGFNTHGTVEGSGGADTTSSSSGSSSSSSSGTGACSAGAPDADGDGVPDACDVCAKGDDKLDADFDGVPDACDVCTKGDDKLDADGDGVPDACDVCAKGDDKLDADSDGVPDACDICAKGDDKLDTDTDGVPDACDICAKGDDKVDTDADGVPDACDVCATGDDKLDADGDGVPDACDVCANGDDKLDADGDGLPDACDLCPYDGPTAPAIPSSTTVSWSSGGKTNTIAFSLTGLGTGTANVAKVAPGFNLHATWDVTVNDCICSGCIDQILVGAGSASLCSGVGVVGCGGASSSWMGNIVAPTTPGAYPIQFSFAQQNSCSAAFASWNPSPENTVGYICVQ